MKYALHTAAALLSAFLISGCGQSEQDNHIKVGAIAGTEAQVVEVAKKVAKEKYGLEVEIVSFSDYVTPNVALNDGSIDVNAFQHKPYLDAQIKDRGYKLVAVGNTFVYPIAGYSKKIKSIDELKAGSQIAVPNDPTNLGRSLLLLQKQGIIKLKADVGLNGTVLDIVENPKQVKIVELEAAQLPRSLDDVDLAIINTTYASQIDPHEQVRGEHRLQARDAMTPLQLGHLDLRVVALNPLIAQMQACSVLFAGAAIGQIPIHHLIPTRVVLFYWHFLCGSHEIKKVKGHSFVAFLWILPTFTSIYMTGFKVCYQPLTTPPWNSSCAALNTSSLW